MLFAMILSIFIHNVFKNILRKIETYFYEIEVEKYPNLVVHGPLVALQLLTFLERASNRYVGYFKYRCMKPGFLPQKIELAANIDGDSYEAWAINPKGEILVRAEGTLNGP